MNICDVCYARTQKVQKGGFLLALEGVEQDEQFSLCREHLEEVRKWIVSPAPKAGGARKVLGLANKPKGIPQQPGLEA